jgi:hypothetical protein
VPFSEDPNEKFGANGVGLKNWVRTDAVIPYRVNFENLGPGSVDGGGNPYATFASAPAQRVTVTDPLKPGLDWSTFQLVELGFGDTMVPIPSGRTHFAGTVPMTFNGRTFNVELEAGIDLASGRVFAIFQSIDPQSSLPPDVLTGFLPTEDGTGRGKGHFSFLVRPRTNLTTGTEIRNVALIEFDRQMSIATDQVDAQNPAAGTDPDKQARNTIDASPPTSTVAPLPSESGRAFWVRWSGLDDAGGSGVESYDVFVSTNGEPFVAWIEGTNGVTAPFIGELGKTYAFYSLARDNVGNQELPPVAPDSQTMVITHAPLIEVVADQVADVGASLVLSNTVASAPADAFLWSLGLRAPLGASINPTNGVLRWTPACAQGSTTNIITVWATDRARTNLSDLVTFTVVVKECVSPQLGRLILRAGDTGRLPIDLITSVPLTNLATFVSAPADRLLPVGVEPVAPEICTNSLAAVTNSLHLLTLTTCSNQWLTGTQQVAWLLVTALSNQHSAFVPVEIGPSIGTQPDGTLVTNYVTQAGRVTVVGEEPLLEALRSTNSQVQLLLYAPPGTTNQIETKPDLASPAPWQVWLQITPTNLVQPAQPVPLTNWSRFFRAVRSE